MIGPGGRIVIVGGGPAGLAAAIVAAERGLDVTLIEKRLPPVDKACGEGLMPRGVELLERLGVNIDPNLCRPFRGLKLISAARSPLVEAAASFTHGVGLGIRRTVLHEALAARAGRLGVRLLWGTRGLGLEGMSVISSQGRHDADAIIGADGLHSTVRRWLKLPTSIGARRRFGLRRHYAIPPWDDRVEVTWGAGADAYVTPVAAHTVGVALLAESGIAPQFEAIVQRFPQLARRLQGAEVVSELRGAGPFRQRVPTGGDERLLLIGDASGYLDPITGEGISLGFAQAFAAIDALTRPGAPSYQAAQRRLRRVPDLFTRATLTIRDHPLLSRATLRTFDLAPRLLSSLLARTS